MPKTIEESQEELEEEELELQRRLAEVQVKKMQAKQREEQKSASKPAVTEEVEEEDQDDDNEQLEDEPMVAATIRYQEAMLQMTPPHEKQSHWMQMSQHYSRLAQSARRNAVQVAQAKEHMKQRQAPRKILHNVTCMPGEEGTVEWTACPIPADKGQPDKLGGAVVLGGAPPGLGSPMHNFPGMQPPSFAPGGYDPAAFANYGFPPPGQMGAPFPGYGPPFLDAASLERGISAPGRYDPNIFKKAKTQDSLGQPDLARANSSASATDEKPEKPEKKPAYTKPIHEMSPIENFATWSDANSDQQNNRFTIAVRASNFKTTNRTLTLDKFEAIIDGKPVNFQLHITAEHISDKRHGWSFKKSLGSGKVELKCREEDPPQRQLWFTIFIGEGKKEFYHRPRGPVLHDFSLRPTASFLPEDEKWAFLDAADQNGNVKISVEVNVPPEKA